jgi:hypothetical protein
VDFGSVSASVHPHRNIVDPMSNESYQMPMTILSNISESPSMPRAAGGSSSPWFPSAPYPLTIARIGTEPTFRTQSYMINRTANVLENQNFEHPSTSTVNVLRAHDSLQNNWWETGRESHDGLIHLGYDGGYQWTQTSSCISAPSYPVTTYDPPRTNARRRRGTLSKSITDILRVWFGDHLDHPYPSDEQKQMLIQRTGLTMNQVSDEKLTPT